MAGILLTADKTTPNGLQGLTQAYMAIIISGDFTQAATASPVVERFWEIKPSGGVWRKYAQAALDYGPTSISISPGVSEGVETVSFEIRQIVRTATFSISSEAFLVSVTQRPYAGTVRFRDIDTNELLPEVIPVTFGSRRNYNIRMEYIPTTEELALLPTITTGVSLGGNTHIKVRSYLTNADPSQLPDFEQIGVSSAILVTSGAPGRTYELDGSATLLSNPGFGGNTNNIRRLNTKFNIEEFIPFANLEYSRPIADIIPWTASKEELSVAIDFKVPTFETDGPIQTVVTQSRLMVSKNDGPYETVSNSTDNDIDLFDVVSKPPFVGKISYIREFRYGFAVNDVMQTAFTYVLMPARSFTTIKSPVNILSDVGMRFIPRRMEAEVNSTVSINAEFYNQYRQDYPADIFTAGEYHWVCSMPDNSNRAEVLPLPGQIAVGPTPGILILQGFYSYTNPDLFLREQIVSLDNSTRIDVQALPPAKTVSVSIPATLNTVYNARVQIPAIVTADEGATLTYEWHTTLNENRNLLPDLFDTDDMYDVNTEVVRQYQIYCNVKATWPDGDEAEADSITCLITVAKAPGLPRTVSISGPSTIVYGSDFEYRADLSAIVPNSTSVIYRWYVNNELRVASGNNSYMARGRFVGNNTLRVDVTVESDTYETTTYTINKPVDVINATSIPLLYITGNMQPLINDPVLFSISVLNEIINPDITYTYEWWLDGTKLPDVTKEIQVTFDAVKDYSLTCNVTIQGTGYDTITSNRIVTIRTSDRGPTDDDYNYFNPLTGTSAFIMIGWWVVLEIMKANAYGIDWTVPSTELKYQKDLRTLALMTQLYPDSKIQESRNGYVWNFEELSGGYDYLNWVEYYTKAGGSE